nr:hypothetical protein [Candidatus Sigynarchaeota archaeon]
MPFLDPPSTPIVVPVFKAILPGAMLENMIKKMLVVLEPLDETVIPIMRANYINEHLKGIAPSIEISIPRTPEFVVLAPPLEPLIFPVRNPIIPAVNGKGEIQSPVALVNVKICNSRTVLDPCREIILTTIEDVSLDREG